MKTFIYVLFVFVVCSNARPQSKIEIGLMGTDQMSLLYKENWFTKKYNRFSPEMDIMIKINCHTYACQVAEQEASVGGDIDEIYEMAYEHCVG
ncbi:hypothetical protein [Zobellia galactanivorans]|uniref:hypothetical protein n=1 Tax=Zobellia galactanivorans (strain DSM 12802 / CCUG 47099 / CIP 106680 / NCIMB 13871 / Dsij) TaxID=63186 RepID=UPI001C065B9B|nr:hypothetical protein [Zobellia galactanivorans]MBU3027556.1 hypothetical protein [Zobellia galactanivorans]